MNGLETKIIQCPCCWQNFEIVVDCSIEEQQYIEDCYVCCRPLILHVTVADGWAIDVHVDAENH